MLHAGKVTLMNAIWNVDQLKRYNRERGLYYFSPETMRFFRSRVAPGVINTWEGVVFITSEQFDYNSPRLYTARIIREDGTVDNLAGCEFQQFENLYHARKFAKIEAAKLNEVPK